jgi:hypothetical protein
MGLKLRLNLYYQVEAHDVYDAYKAFYASRGQDLIDLGDDFFQFTLYEKDQDWTVLGLDSGWEWTVRRQAQLAVSRRLNCRGSLIFVYDGDYWGYEFFECGRSLDQFVQDEEPADGTDWFPGKSCEGAPPLIASRFSHLSANDLAAYLVRDPVWRRTGDELTDEEYEARRTERKRLDVHVRPGDESTRFDDGAVLDFLRFLGIRVELRDHYVTLPAPEYRSFWIAGQNTFRSWERMYGARRGNSR